MPYFSSKSSKSRHSNHKKSTSEQNFRQMVCWGMLRPPPISFGPGYEQKIIVMDCVICPAQAQPRNIWIRFDDFSPLISVHKLLNVEQIKTWSPESFLFLIHSVFDHSSKCKVRFKRWIRRWISEHKCSKREWRVSINRLIAELRQFCGPL